MAQKPVHRSLLIPEVISLICNEVNLSQQRLKTLAALACTCHFFQEPALNHLWSKLSNIGPLVKSMPSDLWRVDSEPIYGKSTASKLVRVIPIRISTSKFLVKCISRPIKPSDWTRFLVHAPRVKRLSVRNSSPRVDIKVYQALSVAARTTVLLPNVKELIWYLSADDDHIFPFVSLFLGPGILIIHLSLKNSGVIGPSLLPTLNSRLPALRRLKLDYEEPTKAIAESLSVAMCGWTQLRVLETGELSKDALINLGGLPCLSRLLCTLARDTILAPITLSNSSWFPVLSRLSIRPKDLTSCSFLVETLSSVPIGTIIVTYAGVHDPLGSRRLLDAMNKCNPSTLASIELKHTFVSPSAHTPNILAIENIRPLFVFSALYSVDLIFWDEVDIDDAGMEELAKAWPQLSSFSMKIYHTIDRKPRVTLAGLIPLVKHCRDLLEIVITVNACEVDVSESRPGKGAVNTEIDTLCVGDSPIEDPVAVAAFLSDIFPAVNTIDNQLNQLPENSKWSQVADLIPTFVSIRRQERNHSSGDRTSGDITS
jgi:hypothetical protein